MNDRMPAEPPAKVHTVLAASPGVVYRALTIGA